MNPIYILMIVASSLFLLLLLIFLFMYIRSCRKFREVQNELRKMFNDKNTPKLDYDFAVYDEEVRRKLEGDSVAEGQLTIDDVIQAAGVSMSDETVFASVEVEEITGNYKP